MNEAIANWKKGKNNGSDKKECVKIKKKGEWEAKECDKDYGIVCEVPGLDCNQVNDDTVVIGGHNCGDNEICVPGSGNSYTCSACQTGFEVDNGVCIDIDECQDSDTVVDLDEDGVCNLVDKDFDDAMNTCSNYGAVVFEPRTSADIDYLASFGEDMFIGIKWDGSNWRYVSGRL